MTHAARSGDGIDTSQSHQEAIRLAATRLAAAGITSARIDAEVLLRHAAGLSRTELFLHYPDPVPPAVLDHFQTLLADRLQGAPVAYLTGTREFMGLLFGVAPGVLIPRPETELLVEWALAHLESGDTVADIGTGSGAIAISIAALAGDVSVVATDISPRAREIAQRNATTLLTADQRDRIDFREGSLLAPVVEPVDMVLANLPYLTPEQVDGNPDLAAEPRLALDGGADGLDLLRDLIADLPRVLHRNGLVGLEIDPAQQAETERLLRAQFPGGTVRTIFDLAGLARHVILQPDETTSRPRSWDWAVSLS